MRVIETLDWIIDYNDSKIVDDEKYKLNIEFVHSLGLKCDCVGWCKLDLSDPNLDEILCKIKVYCKNMNCRVRAYYKRTYVDYESDWYELVPSDFNNNTVCDSEEYNSIKGKMIKVLSIRAYNETNSLPKDWYESVFVPERFRDACIRNNVSGVEFCWAKDKGKYQAEQYFCLYSNYNASSVLSDKGIRKGDKKRISALGGALLKVVEVVDTFQSIDLQNCYLEHDLPSSMIAHAYVPRSFSYTGRNVFLIHKSLAQILIKEKAISEKSLHAAMITRDIPGGYISEKTESMDRPCAECLDQSIVEYEKLKNKDRPIRSVSEKDAIKKFRCAKSERKEDFCKGLPKVTADEVAATKYAPLLPYYKIANGAYISDEYRILPYMEALRETENFAEAMKAEELADIPCGIVIAKCADGDTVLLLEDGSVIRVSHEEPIVSQEWMSLSSFIFEVMDI